MNVKQLQDKDGNAIQPNSPDKAGYIDWSGSPTYITAGTTYTITEDGWIYVGLKVLNTAITTIPTIKINGQSMELAGTGNIQFKNIFFISVKKDDTVLFTLGNASTESVVWFRPLRTALGGGGV